MRTAEIGPDLRLGQSQPHSHGPPWQERERGGGGRGGGKGERTHGRWLGWIQLMLLTDLTFCLFLSW